MTSEIAKKIAERIEVNFPLTDDDPNTHSGRRAFDFADGVAAVVQLICDGGIDDLIAPNGIKNINRHCINYRVDVIETRKIIGGPWMTRAFYYASADDFMLSEVDAFGHLPGESLQKCMDILRTKQEAPI